MQPFRSFFSLFAALALLTVLATTLVVSPQRLLGKEKKKEPKAADYALIKGSVFREDGFSVRGARVTCRRASDSRPKWETVSGEGGEFAFRLPVGKMDYVVTADFQGFEIASKKVTIENDERQDISIVLTAKKP